MLEDLTAMRKSSKVNVSAWGMLRHSQMEEEIGNGLSL
jgi:hypothetical protein